MKKIFNILRSIITSFLFIILIIILITQIIYTTLRINNQRISDLINREDLYNNAINKDLEITKEIGIKYIDEYINYVFYRRSYPSINQNIFENKNELEKRIINDNIKTIKSKINIEYETIITIRKINSFLSNSSMYLLINISIMFVLLLMVIIHKEFNKTLRIFGYALIISTILNLIFSSMINTIFINHEKQIIAIITKNILNHSITKLFFNINIIYLSFGFILCSVIYIINKMLKK